MTLQTEHPLRQTLTDVAVKNAAKDWFVQLNARKKAELDYHNKSRDRELEAKLPEDMHELLHGNRRFYSTVQVSRDYTEKWIRDNVRGKVFLDYACGNGHNSLNAAHAGAALSIGLDISDISVKNATATAQQAGVGDRCFFLQGDCENTGLPDNCIDTIICSGMLHHLDLSYAFPELRRILKPGGKILAVEALDYNPAIKAYRLMTPSMRTDWEKNHILSLKDLRFASRFFNVKDVHYWHLFSIMGAFIPPNSAVRPFAMKVLDGIDKIAMRIPGLKLLAWQFTFVLEKPKEN